MKMLTKTCGDLNVLGFKSYICVETDTDVFCVKKICYCLMSMTPIIFIQPITKECNVSRHLPTGTLMTCANTMTHSQMTPELLFIIKLLLYLN